MIYDKEYYLRHLKYSGTEVEKKLTEFRINAVHKAVQHIPSLVDWGCSHGAFLLEAWKKFKNAEVVGVDINPWCVAHCVHEGLPAFTPEMYRHFCDPEPTVMTFFDSFEHLRNPAQVLEEFRPEVVVISCPNLDAHQRDIQLWKHYRPLEHLWNWKECDLISYLKLHGYEPTDVSYGESMIRVDPVLGDKNIMTITAMRVK